MTDHPMVSESRDVSNFDRVSLRGYGELVIMPGERESLTVETHPDTLPSIVTEVRDRVLVLGRGRNWLERLDLSTSLTRRRIVYRLTARQLRGLEVFGPARIDASRIAVEHFALRISGVGEVHLDSLSSELLEVDADGAARIVVTGEVKEQTVALRGAIEYSAGKLKSNRARVDLAGAGNATVWVAGDLQVIIRGFGKVGYYGNPGVTRNVAGLGSLTHLGYR